MYTKEKIKKKQHNSLSGSKISPTSPPINQPTLAPSPAAKRGPRHALAPAMPNTHPTPAHRPPPPSHCLHSKLQLPIPKSQTLGEQGKRGGRRRAQLGGARHSARAHGGRRRRSAWLGGARRQRSTWLGGGAQLNSGYSARLGGGQRPGARPRGETAPARRRADGIAATGAGTASQRARLPEERASGASCARTTRGGVGRPRRWTGRW